MIPNKMNSIKLFLGSFLALPANGLGGSRATSLLVAHFALQNTKFGSEKGKVQKPARIPPQTPPAGGTEAEAGQLFHSPRKIVCLAESKLVFRIFVKKCSNFRIADRTLACDFKNAFQIAEKYPAEALCAEATSFNFAKSTN
ncbi:hypothetical protein AUJ91_01530 [archaeon CG2_30_31_98]|nr:MAG: hypothetical protein AUJ91_01530 [archaeon CG2_30_31_98]